MYFLVALHANICIITHFLNLSLFVVLQIFQKQFKKFCKRNNITEFKVPGGKKKLYLSAIIDLYDRYPVAYVISARNDNRLVFKTFDKAVAANPDAKPIVPILLCLPCCDEGISSSTTT